MTADIATSILALRPGNGLDLDATSGIIDSTHGVGEGDRDVPDRDQLELSGLAHAVISGARLAASEASGFDIGSSNEFSDDAH